MSMVFSGQRKFSFLLLLFMSCFFLLPFLFVSAFSALFPFLIFLCIRSFIYFKKHGLIIGLGHCFSLEPMRKTKTCEYNYVTVSLNRLSKDNIIDLFPGCARFESSPGHGLSWLNFFMVFPSYSRKMPWYRNYTSIGSFQMLFHLSVIYHFAI